MVPPRTDTPAFALCEGFFADCNVVFTFMSEGVKPTVDRHGPTRDPHGGVHATFLRALFWLSTYRKLTEVSDFQAAVAGTRALFEIVVDLTLLVGDRDKYPVTKLLAWEDSAKLKHAEAIVQRASVDSTIRVSDAFADYIAEHKVQIQSDRDRLWPNSKGKPSVHPARWTGRNLVDDARAADLLGGRDLEQFYVARYSELCWGTHGSGAASVRLLGSDIFPGVAAFAFKEAAEFGMRSARLCLQYLGALDPIAEERFKVAEKERDNQRSLGYAARLPPQ